MLISQNKIIRNWIYLITSIVISFSLIASFVSVSGVSDSNYAKDRFDTFIREENMLRIKNEVDSRIEEIEYDLELIYKEEYTHIKELIEVQEDFLLNSNLLDIENVVDRRNAAVTMFEKLAQANNNYLFFVISPEGDLLRSGTNNEIEGTNILELKDKEGTFFTKEMIKAVENEDGVYVTYFWPKIKDGEPLKKTSYCKYIEELGIIIGTGSYYDDIEQDLKDSTFNRLQSYYEDKEDYVFITGYNGIAYVFANSLYLGKDVTSITDIDGVNLFDGFMSVLKDSENGYFTYKYVKPGTERESDKISYVRRLDRWDAFIGMGFHTDDIALELNSLTKEYNSHQFYNICVTILLLLLSAVGIIFLIRRGLRLQKQLQHQEEGIFRNLFDVSVEGVVIVSKNGEVIYRNTKAVKLIGVKTSEYLKVHDEHEKDGETGVIEIENRDTSRSYFIESTKKPIIYHGMDSDLYFIKDVTDVYEQKNELENLALSDELTNLPNRRKLLNDLEDMKYNGQTNVVMAMIDLDNFKIVNDTYGHEKGDQVLCHLAECFKKRLRSYDMIYRYGGEEFVAILKEVSIKDAVKILENINKEFGDRVKEDLLIKVSFSAGVSEVDSSKEGFIQDSLRESDRLLYKAKNGGRNTIKY